jgi:hypothetical protein
MDALDQRAGRYVFISSHAVYQLDGVGPGSTEDTARRPPVRDTGELTDATYGPLKVACEDDVVARYGARATTSSAAARWYSSSTRVGSVAPTARPHARATTPAGNQ